MRRILRLGRPIAAFAFLSSVTVTAAFSGCDDKKDAPTGPVAETVSPKDSPVSYKVLEDKIDNNSVEYHLLVPEGTKHDDVEGLLKYLYRHLWTRGDNEPAGVAAYVYNSETAFKTPPRTPIAHVIRKSGEVGPTFENKVPLEFWQEVAEALLPNYDDKWKLARKVERDDAQKTLTLTLPYTEPGKDQWVEALSFNQAMNTFTDVAQSLFEKVPELKAMTYVGLWKDKEVVRIQLSRVDYQALKLNDLDDRIGQHHGRIFLELATNRSSDAKAAKENAALIAKEYKAMLGQLKGKAKVDPALK